ncbi:MAG: tRNA (adenosine(37)-N6)-dimethylallyltransferase MiaA [Pseudomonadales bacterium]|nr:tRNA (adenosine(37)-N6)-dimethylallyltransferase MiaA [Pseudomonadales bacterium]
MLAANETRPLPPAIFLMGPTASGKTDLAVALTEILPCDIISVDSAQIYRGMDIGSAKPDAATLQRAPHRLISFLDPSASYSAAQFRQDALREIAAIAAAGRIPLLVGGTMLYFKILLEGIADLPSADPALRASLSAEAEHHGWPALHQRLAALDPITAARLHPNHSQRILRALEVCLLTGSPLSVLQQQQTSPSLPFQPIQLALLPTDRHALHQRIEQRFQRMLAEGLVDEVRQLYQRGDLHPDLPAIRSVGYRQTWDYLAGQISLQELGTNGAAATRQLAKRQLTWLKTWQSLHTIPTPEPFSVQKVTAAALKILATVGI